MSSPRRIGKFEIVRPLATGGMGEVFLARQVGPAGFARAVVVKRLLPHLAKDPGFVQMFLNEGRLTGLLVHPNIAQVYELGEDDGAFFLAMELVHGRSLKSLERTLESQERLIGPGLAARICIDALNGLHAAHTLFIEGKSTAVVHRDMSPDNILVGFNGISKVIDFGVARAVDAASTTRTGTLKGKFAYMAPERFAAEKSELDPRVDVYAVAVVLYEALCGQRPFTEGSDAALIGAILKNTPPPPREVNPLLDPKLSDVIVRGLHRSLDDRWPTAEAMAQALEPFALPSSAVAAFMRSLFGDTEAEANPGRSEPANVTHTLASPRTWRLAGAFSLVVALGGLLGYALMSQLPGPAPIVKTVAAVEPVKKDDRKGRVAFRVKPWGEIWQGDKKLGVTPNVTVEQPVGRQVFTIKHPELPSREIAVEVLPDTEVSVKVDLSAR